MVKRTYSLNYHRARGADAPMKHAAYLFTVSPIATGRWSLRRCPTTQMPRLSLTPRTDALVEMVHKWSEATDKPGTFVRVLFIDYTKAFDLINHELLITKLVDVGLPAHLVRWLAAFLINRQQVVKIGDVVSNTGYPKEASLKEHCLVLKTF